MMRAIPSLAAGSLSLILVSAAATAAAQETAQAGFQADTADIDMNADTAEDDPTIPGSLVIGAEVGAIFPQPFANMGTHVAFGIELGYRLPFIDEKLEILFAAGYTPPYNNFTVTRTEGNYEAELDVQELTFSLGPRFRFLEKSSDFNITLAGGGRLFLLRSYSNGSRDGQKFVEFQEESTNFGFFVALGGEYRIGPGAIFLDVDLGWAKLPHEITGDVNTGNITASLGYRFFLL